MPNNVDVLLRIADTAKQIRLHTAPETAQTNFPQLTTELPLNLQIPSPSSLLPELLNLGIAPSVAHQLASTFSFRAADLAEKFTNIHKVNRIGHIHVERLYQQALSTRKTNILQLARDRLQLSSLANPATKISKSSFNQDYVPLLEAFFAENQFPSRADKGFLARKSSMTTKQINTWFQNRRSRMNKDKSTLSIVPHRTTVARTLERNGGMTEPIQYIPRGIPVASDESGYDSMTECESDEEQMQSVFSSRSSSVTLIGEEEEFVQKAPSHAFPTPYPPVCKEHPFPCKTGNMSFPGPVWARTSTTHVGNQSEPDMESFISAFAKLSIGSRVDPSSEPTKSVPQGTSRGYDVTAPITIRPLPAPLPSLIRTARAFKPSAAPQPASTSKETRRRTSVHAPNRSSAGSSSGTAAHAKSPEQCNASTKKKSPKKAALPKRVPISKPIYRDAHPPPQPRGRVQTRTSSFCSEGSIPSLCRSGSSSSASSETSSPSPPSDPLDSVSAPLIASSTFDFSLLS